MKTIKTPAEAHKNHALSTGTLSNDALKRTEPRLPLLEVSGLSVSFTQYAKGLRQRQLEVISDLNIDLQPGEILAVVGSSGSGKSLLAHSILGILPSNARVSGRMLYKGQPLDSRRQASLRGREMVLVPQSVNFLDPLMRVGRQVQNAIRSAAAADIQKDIFQRYKLPAASAGLFPFQLSGGMARRVLLATAVNSGASLIIADEPTPGMHPEVVEETARHLRELADEGAGIVFITHDIDTALKIADRIAVFYAGTTVEVAQAGDFTGDGNRLRHPFTRALWQALPQNELRPIPGFQPPPTDLPCGCLFSPRCNCVSPECACSRPQMRELRSGLVRCHHAS